MFGVLPVFAFANVGVPLTGLALPDVLHPVSLGIALGLFIGKPVGIMLMSWLAVRIGVASLASGLRWSQMFGAAVLCGVGFTMSLFVASLAYGPDVPHANLDRLGILVGSGLSGLAGYALLRFTSRQGA